MADSSAVIQVELGAASYERERAELAVVLGSEPFRRSPQLSRLLAYLCERYFEGRAQEIKEYTIAVDVLGRNRDFDPQIDAIVRVDTHLLRKRLKQYYAGDGQDHELQVVVPAGRYIPEFVTRSEVVAPETADPEPAEPLTGTAPIALSTTDQRALAESPMPVTGAAIETPAASVLATPPVAPPMGLVTSAASTVEVLPPTLGQKLGQNQGHSKVMWWLGGAAVCVALATLSLLPPRKPTPTPAATAAAAPIATAPVATIDTGDDIRILAGNRKSEYIDKAGRAWLPDRYFKGGTPFHRAPEIQRTADPEIFQNGREGWFLYDIPLKPGKYELHLYFAETGVQAEGMRSINVAINNVPSTFLDIASDAGGVNIATQKFYKNVSPGADGLLHLTFPDPSFLNALEIVPAGSAPGVSPKMRPIRLTTRETAYKDHNGNLWLPDTSVSGGRRSGRDAPIEGSEDAELYHTQRFGHFTYSIPVADGGRYTVKLYFAETWFNTVHAPGGPGSRIFDVYCNGTTLLSNFDILKETSSNHALVRAFHGLAASPQGKLNLEFSPRANYALLNAIEIIEE